MSQHDEILLHRMPFAHQRCIQLQVRWDEEEDLTPHAGLAASLHKDSVVAEW